MPPSLRLVFAVHNHQPVGNFDGVFEQACQDAYEPFLDIIDDFPEIPMTLHLSGSLLEWLERHRTAYVERVRQAVQEGRIEILGGPFFEPILAAIPSRDRIGQIESYKQHLEQLFESPIRGMWVPERVWEPNFASSIVDAGIEYTILDDSHFRWAGFADDQLHGYYATEDEGRLLKVFPGDETLRYTIPWSDPHETIGYLRQIAERCPGTIVSVGDDGEKFGSWPGTHEHVYEKGWLRGFFQQLRDNSDWLHVVTMAQAVDQVPPRGKVYLPNASYREMTEWALPTEQQLLYHQHYERLSQQPDWAELKPFVRAGFWRNFLVKYPEANDMYCRSREVSDRLNRVASSKSSPDQSDLLRSARLDLFRGQCNCPYWHGAFGGLYLPHLRNAIYRHLIAADSAVEKLSGRTGRWVAVDVADFNLDARKEVRISGEKLVGYLSPARGGHLYELDIRETRINLLSTLNRRPEPYHQTVRDAAGMGGEVAAENHEGVRFKQANLDQQIVYDHWPRKSLVDHFLRPGTTIDEFQRGESGIGDFVLGVYETRIRQSKRRVEVVMSRNGRVGAHRISMTKTVSLDTASGGSLEIQYELEDLPPGEAIHFAVEFNFAALAAGAEDRYYYNDAGIQLGPLETVQALDEGTRIGLVDEWLGLDASLDFSRSAGVWTFPIQSVSQSEGGFELVHQSSAVIPHWEFVADDSGYWNVQLQLATDTSMAAARQLAEVSAH